MRTSIRRPAVLAATAVAVLSMALTACGGDDNAKGDAGAGTTGSTTAGSGTSGSDTGGSGTSGSDTGGSADAATMAGAKKSAVKAPACTVNDVKVTAAKQDGVPTTHITLTAKNISGHTCTLLQYPLIGFGDLPQTSKDVPPVAKSKPGTPIVLQAGAPAYAAVRINNGGVDEENHAVTSFYVNLFASDGPAEGSKTVTAPNGGIAVDDAAAKTGYWTYELRNGADDF
ncbi:DUF4232 domain-containing protein [Streptomyces sp. NPDC057136]|uniref:DUF4232 domain-containing protein n=1 Tax=Streptomyces sp. NPDC057136 TaxID=3346029 RepID=UPI003639594D